MTQAEFHAMLICASFLALRFGKGFVTQDLPVDLFRYQVWLNQSHDGNRMEDEVVYPADDGKVLEGFSEQEVVGLLYRDGRCPEWIDVQVEAVGAGVTVFRLDCCGRYTDDKRRMYYSKRGLGPFGVKSPDLPPGFKEGDRFALKVV
jgi:hypothetical protein